MAATIVNVTYVVKSVEVALRFYCQRLGFKELSFPLRSLAVLERGNLRLTLVTPPGQAENESALEVAQPGGWNRFQLEVADLDAEVQKLGEQGVRFRGEPATRLGSMYAIAEDPSGNPIELFQQVSQHP